MPGYQTKSETIAIDGKDYIIRSLLDNQQYADPLGAAGDVGMSPSSWPLFGQVWPSARVLALLMATYDIAGKRVLEIGAGLALASLVVHRRDGDMTVSDWHPLTLDFLNANLALNQLNPMKYQPGNWEAVNPDLGEFDLIIGSDILYERQQPKQLATFILAHAAVGAQIVIVDPDRGNRARFCQEMAAVGFGFTTIRAASVLESGEPFKGRILTFSKIIASMGQH